MKRRLSDDSTFLVPLVIGVLGLGVILSFALRATSLTWEFGIIEGEIPVLQVPLLDQGYHRFDPQPYTSLSDKTPTILLTSDAFIFGDLYNFTVKFADVRGKYRIDHVEGSPQLHQLILSIAKWLEREQLAPPNENSGYIVLLIPTGEVPIPILSQVMAGLRASKLFDRIVIGGGLI